MRYLFNALLCATLLTTLPGYAAAHAYLDHSTPSSGAVVATAPASVQLWFSKGLEPSFSNVHVIDENGTQVDSGTSAVSDNEPKRIEVGLKPLKAGKYRVIWRIVALDGHKAKGEFAFTVR